MKILIAAAGSRGDVAPYTGLGAEPRRAGHDVALATTPGRSRTITGMVEAFSDYGFPQSHAQSMAGLSENAAMGILSARAEHLFALLRHF